MADLHERLTAAVEARLEVARAATPGPWAPDHPWLSDVVNSALLGAVADCSVGTGYRAQSLEDARHIAAHDPATVIRHCERDLRVLRRHKVCHGLDPAYCPHPQFNACHRCAQNHPCDEIRDLAEAYAVEVGDV